MEQKDEKTNTNKKSTLIKVVIGIAILVVAYFVGYYVVSEFISGFGEAYKE